MTTALRQNNPQKAPSLIAVLFWNIFTAVHASFMITAFWGSWTVIFLFLFYSIFFGAGFWMARSWYRARHLNRYGRPTLLNSEPLVPGKPARIEVRFDRQWKAREAVSASLRWTVDQVDNNERQEAEVPVAGQATPQDKGMLWSANVIVPLPPATAEDEELELELRLRPLRDQRQGDKAEEDGWTVTLPMAETTNPAYDSEHRTEITPQDREKLSKIFGGIALVLLLAGGGLMASALLEEPFAFSGLTMPLGLLLASWIMFNLRRPLLQSQENSQQSAAEQIKRMKPVGTAFFVLALASFIGDAFLPGDIHEKINSTLHTAKASLGLASEDVAPATQEQTPATPEDAAFGAIYYSDVSALQKLLDEGVDPNTVSPRGRRENLLMAAARVQNRSTDMIDLLLTRGAKLDALDRHGKNATDWAEFFHNADASDLLCSRGLEPTPIDTNTPENERGKRASCAQPSGARSQQS